MSNIAGLVIFAIGIVVLVLGYNSSQSFSSDFSRFFTGNPTDKSIRMLIGGGVAVIVGLFIAIRGSRKGH